MKQDVKTGLIALMISLAALTGYGQEEITTKSSSTPRWVSSKGFWMVERNLKQPRVRTIYFYNNDKVQVYSETITANKFKLNKRKTLLRIKQALETAVTAWENNQPLGGNANLFIAAGN